MSKLQFQTVHVVPLETELTLLGHPKQNIYQLGSTSLQPPRWPPTMVPPALGFSVQSNNSVQFLVSKGLPKAVISKQICLYTISIYPPHVCGQHLEVLHLHWKCRSWSHSLLLHSRHRQVWLRAQQSSWIICVHSSLVGSMGSFPSRRQGSFQEQFWKTKTINVLSTLCASPECVFFIVKKSSVSHLATITFYFLVIPYSNPELLFGKAVCKTQKQFHIKDFWCDLTTKSYHVKELVMMIFWIFKGFQNDL